MTTSLIEKLNWKKMKNLIPVVVQDNDTRQVLMLGYMNQAALEQTLSSNRITFFSRSKNRLWTKGETSGNYLEWIDIIPDCDGDSLLIWVQPHNVCCHLGNFSCFSDEISGVFFIGQLEKRIKQRLKEYSENSYISKLFASGIKRIAQKVGEEGVEVALAAVAENENKKEVKEELINEAADLFFHTLILLQAKKVEFSEVMAELKRRFEIYE